MVISKFPISFRSAPNITLATTVLIILLQEHSNGEAFPDRWLYKSSP
jgi:hypothetical protein